MKEKYDVQFSAKVKKGNAVISHTEFDNSDFTFELSEKKGVIKGILKAKADMVMKDLEIETTRNFEKDDLFFANGYQSWSTTREYCRYDTTKDILPLGKKLGGFAAYACGIMSDYSFGDYYGKTGNFHSYTYTYFRKKGSRNITLYGSKTERQGFTLFLVDMPNSKFIIKKDIEGLLLRAGDEYEVFDIAVIEKEFDAAFDEYFFDFVGVKKPKISHLQATHRGITISQKSARIFASATSTVLTEQKKALIFSRQTTAIRQQRATGSSPIRKSSPTE